MSSHDDVGHLHATKPKKKRRASMDQVADAEPKAKKQKQAPVGSAAAGPPADSCVPDISDAVGNGKIPKIKRKAIDGDKQTSVKAAEVEVEKPLVAASDVSRKKAKLRRTIATTSAADAAAAESPLAPAQGNVQSPGATATTRKGKKRKLSEALEIGVAAATDGATEAAAIPAGSAAALKATKKKKLRHVQQEVAAAPLMAETPDAAAIADPAARDKERRKKHRKQKTAGAGAREEAHADILAAQEVNDEVEGEGSGAKIAPGSSSGAAEDGLPQSTGNKNGDKLGKARSFQRVNADEWLDKKGAWNNSYEATFGNAGWGAGAQAVLGQVRGRDFRHEKTKKKRGTYRGGQIDHSVNSFKFESDDE